MSPELDLHDLEEARDEIRDAIVSILGVAIVTPDARDELTESMFKLGSAHMTVERAIEAHGETAEETNEP